MNKTAEILKAFAAGEITAEQAQTLMEQKDQRPLTMKVSLKGGVSVYGLQRMPVTLYANQWKRLLEASTQVLDFIEQHEKELSVKKAA
jgi:hypothetical protein